MSGYTCPTCGKESRLPDYCCGRMMPKQGTYFCDSCKSTSSEPSDCCGTSMRMI